MGRHRRRWALAALFVYDHLRRRAARDRGPEHMRLEDYAFRYDRGAFWIAPRKCGGSLPARVLLGGYATADSLYRWRRLERRAVPDARSRRALQDCLVPMAEVEGFVRALRRHLQGPLWLLPIRSRSDDLFGLRPGAHISAPARPSGRSTIATSTRACGASTAPRAPSPTSTTSSPPAGRPARPGPDGSRSSGVWKQGLPAGLHGEPPR